MGTNYYVRKNHCECCNRHDREYHIGKSSYGWAMTFQGYPWNKLDSWKNWKEFLKNEVIIDECGDVIDYDEFVTMVETYKSPGFKRDDGHVNKSHYVECSKEGHRMDRDWVDEDGYSFTTTEFS